VNAAARWLPKLVVSCYYEHSLDPIPEVVPRVACRTRPLTADDLGLFGNVRAMPPQKVEQFRQRFAQGDECFGAFVDDRLVHYNWVQYRGIHSLQEEGLRARCPDGGFWLYDARTGEAARGQHVYPFVQAHIMRTMRDRGFRRCLVYTGSGNAASRKGMARSGFRFVRKLYSVHWLGRAFPLPRVWFRKRVVELATDGSYR
jgi:hypothetical protein